MTDLSKLTVSLTKNGAHKISYLIRKYGVDEILNHVDDHDLSIHIDQAQARKNLSKGTNGKPLALWDNAKDLGDEAIDSLTIIAIIFSHHKLIKAMISSASNLELKGRLSRDSLGNKEYTNFAFALSDLGFATQKNPNSIGYNFSQILKVKGLGILVKELLTEKLKVAGFAGHSVIDEMIRLNFHRALSLKSDTFADWINGEEKAGKVLDDIELDIGEIAYFSDTQEEESLDTWKFKSGHKAKNEGHSYRKTAPKNVIAKLQHNEIQNAMFEQMVAKYGKSNVGTEIYGVDLALLDSGETIFYEIKTASTLKACIRQAIPQLLEYAYWPNAERANKLIITSPHAIDNEGEAYLDYLRIKFNLPLYYEQFQLT